MADSQLVTGTASLMSASSWQLPAVAANVVELLQTQSSHCGDQPAFTFLHEDGRQTQLTYAELDRKARAIAAILQPRTKRGQRVLLVYPPGLDFICGFFGCLYAGVLAVPATYPKPRRPMPRLTAIARDCDASVALTASQTLATLDFDRIQPDLRSLHWIATDDVADGAARQWTPPTISRDDIAFLQYTSGSTSEPKGVMVSHGNLLYNLEMIRRGFDIRGGGANGPYTGVFWLPAYHDMGLIGGILEPLYVGGHSILMPPASFLQRPIRWLAAVSHWHADISGAPNFAYELCVAKTTPAQRAELDLSSWRLAFCGAEPIRAETLERFAETFGPCGFRPDAYYPCYGLAEATLIAAGGQGPGRPVVKRVLRRPLTDHRVVSANGHPDGQIQQLVSCGRPLLDQQIVIVDPITRQRCGSNRVGEIWIQGPSVARGYWNRPEENQQTFGARLADDDRQTYLRTGDLGFISDGQLFITGRVKDVIIIRGRNHYPQDIERTAQQAHPALRTSAGAAFSIEAAGQERLVVIHEIDRQYRDLDLQQILREVRRAIAVEHELEAYDVVLIRQASLPMTTSGKPQRNLCRQRYLAGQLKVLAHLARGGGNGRPQASIPAGGGNGKPSDNGEPRCPIEASPSGNGRAKPLPQRPDKPLSANEVDRLAERIEAWLLDWLVERAGVPQAEIDRHKPFADYGLDSLTAVELSHELEQWLHVQLAPVVAWNYPTPASMAGYLARLAGGLESPTAPEPEPVAGGEADTDFEQMLSQIEQMSDEDAWAALDGDQGQPPA